MNGTIKTLNQTIETLKNQYQEIGTAKEDAKNKLYEEYNGVFEGLVITRIDDCFGFGEKGIAIHLGTTSRQESRWDEILVIEKTLKGIVAKVNWSATSTDTGEGERFQGWKRYAEDLAKAFTIAEAIAADRYTALDMIFKRYEEIEKGFDIYTIRRQIEEIEKIVSQMEREEKVKEALKYFENGIWFRQYHTYDISKRVAIRNAKVEVGKKDGEYIVWHGHGSDFSLKHKIDSSTLIGMYKWASQTNITYGYKERDYVNKIYYSMPPFGYTTYEESKVEAAQTEISEEEYNAIKFARRF